MFTPPGLVGLANSLPGIPGRLRIADIQLDGYPDIVYTILYFDSAASMNKSMTQVLENYGDANG